MHIRAAARNLQLAGRRFLTPLIIPSFSSRAKPPAAVSEFLQKTLPAIGGPVLISAYDVGNQAADAEIEIMSEIADAGLSFVLLDSGGYEVLWNELAVQAGLIKAGSAPEWSLDRYHSVLASWPLEIPLLAVSYDQSETSIEHQIELANELARRYPHHSIEVLLKRPSDKFIEEIAAAASKLAAFPVIGVTEAEIGATMAVRLHFIARLREILAEAGLDTPIHIFGGLDPQMTPLYQAAGADIFDGLSWIRYAYVDGAGIYDKGFVATNYPNAVEADQLWGMRTQNIRYLVNLQIKMTRFLSSRDFSAFAASSRSLERAWNECWERD